MDGETPGPDPNEIQTPLESADSNAEVVQGLQDRIEDPQELRTFSKEHDVKSGKWGSGATEALEAFHEKYSQWPGQEEEDRQMKEYLGFGEGSVWETKALEAYKTMFPREPLEEDNWKKAARLVKKEIKDTRLEEYERHKGWSEDDSKESVESSVDSEKIESIRANGETIGKDESNRDAILVNTEKNVYGVFDGVGHERGSAEAAARSSEFIGEKISSDAKYSSVEEVQDHLKQILEDVDRELGDIGSTTASVAKIWKQDDEMFLVWANVGDSRVYLLRDEEPNPQLIQVSTDDSGVNNALENKQITQQQAEKIDQATVKSVLTEEELALFNDRHFIWDSLGGGGQATIKSGNIRLKQGDRVALTTDGIHDNLTNAAIVNSLITQHPEISLIEQAYDYAIRGHDRSKRDDMSAVVIEFPPFVDRFADFPDVGS